ncbi:sulfatase family protein [Sedimentisphaera salicampi]|uniref:sulfatase family protein n=1 Tax=Sedimentisphaera salicampi TaxID=1941349 RepID=UPI000B9D4076|nr:sulfatase [Sedimentisphaera salicampi]OXU15472.1 Arylsulfatase [Sedimentisphaera salicampi]
MKRRTFLRNLGFQAAALTFGAGLASGAEKKKPNFVFFITDDISPQDLGFYGNQHVKTPNLDRAAKQSLVFDNAYLTISSCSPSRCSIITGRYPHNTGAPELHTPLPKQQHTFMQEFHNAGYYTALAGKNHMGRKESLGFDLVVDSRPSGSEKWMDVLKGRPKDKPFFMWFASHDAHRAWQINDKAPKYEREDVNIPPMMYDGPAARGNLAGYYHEVSRTDHYAGKVLEELKRQGELENTYFIYTADNGRPFIRCKNYMYDSGIKTPLLIKGPGVKQGRTDSLVSSVDYAATFLELAGLKKPETVQGVSFARTLSNHQHQSRDVAFAERNWHVYKLHERMVRTGDWLYIWNAYPGEYNVCGESSSYGFEDVKEFWKAAEEGKLTVNQMKVTKKEQPEEQLFNVREDPHQFCDRSKDPACKEIMNKMRSLLDRWKKQTGDSVPKNPTPDRGTLHHNGKMGKRGDFPGAANNATEINHPGPIKL